MRVINQPATKIRAYPIQGLCIGRIEKLSYPVQDYTPKRILAILISFESADSKKLES